MALDFLKLAQVVDILWVMQSSVFGLHIYVCVGVCQCTCVCMFSLVATWCDLDRVFVSCVCVCCTIK